MGRVTQQIVHGETVSEAPSEVPGRRHYDRSYISGGRLFSYAHQMHTALTFKPQHVVEIGVGPGATRAVLELVGIRVTTVDVQPELEPDIVGSVLDLPLEDDACDVAMCCQVLEHLPFEQFGEALRELGRVSRLGIVMSLPDCSPHYEIRVRLPFLRPFVWTGTRSRDPGPAWKEERRRNDGHYWEIGYHGYGPAVIRQAIAAAGLTIVDSFRVPEKPYHHMFKLVNG